MSCVDPDRSLCLDQNVPAWEVDQQLRGSRGRRAKLRVSDLALSSSATAVEQEPGAVSEDERWQPDATGRRNIHTSSREDQRNESQIETGTGSIDTRGSRFHTIAGTGERGRRKAHRRPEELGHAGGRHFQPALQPAEAGHDKNVNKLQVAWMFSTGVLRGHEGSPLVVGDMMYIHTPFPNNVFAIDLERPERSSGSTSRSRIRR